MVIEFNIQGESEEGYILESLARGSLFINHVSSAAITNA
jgi:hypothetical protein